MATETGIEAIKKILVIRLDRVGDLILSTPFFRNLRDRFPGAEISAVVPPYTTDVLEGNPSVDRIIPFAGKHTPKEIHAFTRPLAAAHPDCAIALSPVSAAYMMAFLSGAPLRLGYVYSRRWLTRIFARSLLTHVHVLALDEALQKGEAIPHEVDQTLALLKHLGLPAVPCGLELYPGPAAEKFAHETIAAWGSPQAIVGLHLSEKWLTGTWNQDHIHTLVKELIRGSENRGVLVTYGALESKLGVEMGEFFKTDTRVRVLGNLPFRKWAALVGCCSVFLTTDTGALHCAVAMKVPVLAVYEDRTFDHCSRQWSPWQSPGLVFRKTLPGETIAALAAGVRTFLDTPAGESCKEQG